MNTFLVKNLLFVLFFFCSGLSGAIVMHAQNPEICNNGIDDDGDGMIDLNDKDCDCPLELPTSLIPNPSFEDRTGCPQNEGELDLAVAWQQASEATTDYMHTCGFLEHVVIRESPPLPMPDGNGCIGFRNGKPSNPNFKESTGACLLERLKAGTSYTMNMWVGFGSNATSPEFELVLYGANGCNTPGILPYGIGNPDVGCPLNIPGYELLGSAVLNGENEWVNADISFIPTRDLDVIVIGPNCNQNPFNHYYYFDNLIIQESAQFGEPPLVTGHPCMNNVSLDLPENFVGSDFQWYKDGVAIIGETNDAFQIPINDIEKANYQVRIVKPDGSCEISAPYIFEIPNIVTNTDVETCDNEPVILNNQSINESGAFTEYFITPDNCDSTVITNVTVHPSYDLFIVEKLCQGEEYILGTQTLTNDGLYTEFFNSSYGCDSIVTVEIEIVEALISIDAQGDNTIRLGEQTPINAEFSDISQTGTYFWTSSDSLTNICDTCAYQLVSPTSTTSYTLLVTDTRGCSISDNVIVQVEKFYEIYFPTAFSPNQDGVNDLYYPFATSNVSQILSLDIYDRWGNQVYHGEQFPASNELFGWNGLFRNNPANTGVYVYVSKVEFIDGQIDTFKGDLVLLR